MTELKIPSTLDGSEEPVLFDFPEGKSDVPLLVGLHTWSFDRFNQVEAMLPRCRERGWALLLPEFRGPNLPTNPRASMAAGSALARQDVMDAVAFVQKKYAIDAAHIFLMGGSGGGHMALMMAAHAPALWRAVSAWVPITDLARWHEENPKYAPGIAACCGGVPGESEAVDRAYRARSPIFCIDALSKANVSVHHGRHDKSVPYTHTFVLAQEMEKRGAKRFYFEIFDGGHELRYDVAFRWFDMQIHQAPRQTATG